ncbi:MAG: helix-turn-helix transcriptional regulator [Coprococcus sp.]|nr:helix-turn-helix transcriptional regulator [Coprococcus sp.]
MDNNKETIIQATIDLINEKGAQMNALTVREICQKANIGLGLINYHFGSKDKLIELCVERIVNGIVENFCSIREETAGLTAFEKIDRLGNMTLTFLFEHYAVSKISILSDMQRPKKDDNTHKTYLAYLPLISACRPDWDREKVERKTFCLISAMQQLFLRHKVIEQLYGVDMMIPEEREAFHRTILHDILEV